MLELYAGLLICRGLTLESIVACCCSTSGKPVWYMVRLAWVRTVLRHGDDMETLWKIENACLHIRKTSKQETSKQILLKAGSLKRKAIILVRYVYNLPDYNTGHNMMKQKDVLRQSSVRILLGSAVWVPLPSLPAGISVSTSKKTYLLLPFELYSCGGWTQVNSGEFHLNMATPPLLLLPHFPENLINKTNLPCLLFFGIFLHHILYTDWASFYGFLFP